MGVVLWFACLVFSPLVSLLGDADFGAREKAQAVLRAALPLSEPALLVGRGSASPEVAFRCRALTGRCVSGVAADYWAAYRLLTAEFDDADGLPWTPVWVHQAYGKDDLVRAALVDLSRAMGLLGETESAYFDPKNTWVGEEYWLAGLDEVRMRRLGVIPLGWSAQVNLTTKDGLAAAKRNWAGLKAARRK